MTNGGLSDATKEVDAGVSVLVFTAEGSLR